MSHHDARFVGWLVRHHLLMSFTAQRKDITDPDVVQEFARSVGDQEHLNNLYLLTIADIRGTSPHVWNAWKGRLLEDLYHAATRSIRHGLSMPQDTEERVSDIREAVRSQLDQRQVSREQLESFWRSLAPDYFLRHSSDELAWHVNAIAATRAIDLPLVAVRSRPRLDALVFLIYAPESEQLLSLVTKGFERMNLNIADAKIHTTLSGFALYTFVALEEDLSEGMDKTHINYVEKELRHRIVHDTEPEPDKVYRLPRKLKHFHIETRVNFSQAPNHTVMEVIALDQPGLLHRVSRCLLQCKVHLVTAKIATFGERVEDVFFIVDRDGNAVTDSEQLECLRSNIMSSLTVPSEQGQAASA
jgi:[protein-PII] uridylyltransferase